MINSLLTGLKMQRSLFKEAVGKCMAVNLQSNRLSDFPADTCICLRQQVGTIHCVQVCPHHPQSSHSLWQHVRAPHSDNRTDLKHHTTTRCILHKVIGECIFHICLSKNHLCLGHDLSPVLGRHLDSSSPSGHCGRNQNTH